MTILERGPIQTVEAAMLILEIQEEEAVWKIELRSFIVS
jgi:hypothetical protein